MSPFSAATPSTTPPDADDTTVEVAAATLAEVIAALAKLRAQQAALRKAQAVAMRELESMDSIEQGHAPPGLNDLDALFANAR